MARISLPDGRTGLARGSGRAGSAELCRWPRRRAPLAPRSRRAAPRRIGATETNIEQLTADAKPRGSGAAGALLRCGSCASWALAQSRVAVLSGDARRGRGRAPAAQRSDGAERRGDRFLLCPPLVRQAAAQERLITASTATPPALATRFLRDTVCLNFCVDLVRPGKTTKACRRSPTLGYEANRSLRAGVLSRGCFSARCLHSPRGRRGAEPGRAALLLKAKQNEEHPAGCRGG